MTDIMLIELTDEELDMVAAGAYNYYSGTNTANASNGSSSSTVTVTQTSTGSALPPGFTFPGFTS